MTPKLILVPPRPVSDITEAEVQERAAAALARLRAHPEYPAIREAALACGLIREAS